MYPSVPRFIERLFVINIHQTFVLCKEIEYVILCSSPLCNYNTHFFDTFRHSGGNRPEFWTLFYLYGESYKSEIRTLSTADSFSILSMVGEYVSLAILLIVDLEIPVMAANFRADTFFLYMMSASNIFILILSAAFNFLFNKSEFQYSMSYYLRILYFYGRIL